MSGSNHAASVSGLSKVHLQWNSETGDWRSPTRIDIFMFDSLVFMFLQHKNCEITMGVAEYKLRFKLKLSRSGGPKAQQEPVSSSYIHSAAEWALLLQLHTIIEQHTRSSPRKEINQVKIISVQNKQTNKQAWLGVRGFFFTELNQNSCSWNRLVMAFCPHHPMSSLLKVMWTLHWIHLKKLIFEILLSFSTIR